MSQRRDEELVGRKEHHDRDGGNREQLLAILIFI